MSDWEHTQQQQHHEQQYDQSAAMHASYSDSSLSGANAAAAPAPRSPSHSSGGAGNMLASPGPHPLPAYLKQIGAHVSALAARDTSAAAGGGSVTPLLAAFVARAITLEAEESAAARGEPSPYPISNGADSAAAGGGVAMGMGMGAAGAVQTISLSPAAQEKLVSATLHRLRQLDDPMLETIKMQVSFEAMYASEIQRKREANYKLDVANSAQLARILDIGTNIQSNAQVASLYRAIFKLMLANGCIEQQGGAASASSSSAAAAGGAAAPPGDRNVDREIAAALESVFPQSGLNAFNMLSTADKRAQVLNLINIVLGIRLFNRDIKKGGAGLADVPGLASAEVEALYDSLEKESTALGDICFTYSDVLQLELAAPASIAASVLRLQDELANRRQYILLVHQLQHEVLSSLDLLADSRAKFAALCSELRTLVGLRSSVPKEQVYPKFQGLAMLWRLMVEERELNRLRLGVFERVLLRFRQSFTSNLLEEDIALLRARKKDPRAMAADAERAAREARIEFDEFVETVAEPPPALEGSDEMGLGAGAAGMSAGSSYRPVRLVKEQTPSFMSLPLEFQGYCPWSIVHRGGLLLPGNPGLGIIRVLGRQYSFCTGEAMRAFAEDPEKYVEGVLAQARRAPALIHLLCLQPYIPHSDISELFALDAMGGAAGDDHGGASSSSARVSAGCQTPHYINTTIPDAHYCWNEWDLRRSAIQLADLTNKRTVSQQTDLSHFRRDNSTQYTLAERGADGVADGKGTQTGIEKSSQVERVYRFHAGLRGKPDRGPSDPGAQMHVVELRVPTHVEDHTNASLKLKPNESLKTYIVRDRQHK